MRVSEEERSPEFVNLYFPYAGWDLFFAGSSGILNSNWHMTVEGRSNVVLNMHA